MANHMLHASWSVCMCWQSHLKLVDLLQARMESELIPVNTKRWSPALRRFLVLEGKVKQESVKIHW